MANLVSAPTYVNIDRPLSEIKRLIGKRAALKADDAKLKLKIGKQIALIKAARPNNWVEIVKDECGLGQRSAYNYLAIAEGKLDELRASNREANSRRELCRDRHTQRHPHRPYVVSRNETKNFRLIWS